MALWLYFSSTCQWHLIKEENHLSTGEKQDDNLECLALPGFKSKYFLTFDILTVEQNFQTFI